MRAPAGPVEEGDFAHMFLDDLLDDREPEASPPDPRRHIGLGQSLTVFGKTGAGTEHIDHEMLVIAMELELDAVASEAIFAAIPPCFNRFNAVLHDIGEGLGE